MTDAFWMACALVLLIEGLGPFLFPRKWRSYIGQLSQQPISILRQIGGMMVTMGLVWLFLLFS